jgi:hypothetical protein
VASRLRVAVALLVALLALAGAAGCGNKSAARTQADTEGPYLDVGPLKYQVQISRQLNPRDSEDRTYLAGVAPGLAASLRPDETWFAVFVRVINDGKTPHRSSGDFSIEDTQGRVFQPVPVRANPLAYQPALIPPGGELPASGTLAEAAPIGGSMLLFKLTLPSLANRPLELRIKSAGAPQREGTVDLDV